MQEEDWELARMRLLVGENQWWEAGREFTGRGLPAPHEGLEYLLNVMRS